MSHKPSSSPYSEDYDIFLTCTLMARETAKVKWQYRHAKSREIETIGTLHLTKHRLIALVRSLRLGGARITLTGTFLAHHPEVHQEGR